MKNVQVFFHLCVVTSVLASATLFADDAKKTVVAPPVSKPAGGPIVVEDKTFAPPIIGKVIEKISTVKYTYLKIKTKTDEAWVAVPLVEISLNTEVEVARPLPMFGFESKALKRKFDRLYFGMLKSQTDELHKERENQAAKKL